MVVGKGMIANAFLNYKDQADIVFFASGVSNSKETNLTAFNREENLLKDYLGTHPEKLFVYFSTCSVYDPAENESLYVKHKLKMEALIRNVSNKYLILRVSNVVGNSENKSIIFNFLVEHLLNNYHFTLWKNAYRNLIDIEDVKLLVISLIEKGSYNRIVNIANPTNIAVTEIVGTIEQFFKIKGNYTFVEKGANFCIDCGEIETIGNEIRSNFFQDYINLLLKKYYQRIHEQHSGQLF